MRNWVAMLVVIALLAMGWIAWLSTRSADAETLSRIDDILSTTAPPDEPAAYLSCASCHLHQGSGRPDGSIPRLDGQKQAVIEAKLKNVRSGFAHLPVMLPFARALSPAQITQIATYLSTRQAVWANEVSVSTSASEMKAGASGYATHCASCHGKSGEGSEEILAPRICGQYAGYLDRRLQQIAAGKRGSVDAVMASVLQTLSAEELVPIVKFLARGDDCVELGMPLGEAQSQ